MMKHDYFLCLMKLINQIQSSNKLTQRTVNIEMVNSRMYLYGEYYKAFSIHFPIKVVIITLLWKCLRYEIEQFI